jgi:gliding motility-associated protein GldC
MKKSKIQFEVSLGEDNIPEKITWSADDNEGGKTLDTKAIALSIWDTDRVDSLQLDLWTKEMNIDEMKRFYVNQIGATSSTLLNATGDEELANKVKNFCEELVTYLETQ